MTPLSGPGPELWDAAILTCPYCRALVLPASMKAHGQWHEMIVSLLKEAGAETGL